MGDSVSPAKIQNVFVLILENRAFDHMLGFSKITGRDSIAGQATSLNGLIGTETNSYSGTTYQVSQPADWAMSVDPGHELPDVLCQLAGPGAKYQPGGVYPPINNSGFVASYAAVCQSSDQHAKQHRPVGEILKCYTPAQLPVLNALATEFAICDGWHASMPGPTWPNRLFVHGASSGGLDHSPTQAEIFEWETVDGFAFKNGSIFDRLKASGITRRLYAGDDFPMTASLQGIHLDDIRPYKNFANDLAGTSYPYNYVFIEPSYQVLNDYKCSTSQHPLSDITRGEVLIKNVYEAIRKSSVWNSSLLIITWDEHGGFYDHAIPPSAVAPGDTTPGTGHNQFGFTFEQLGPRVPAVIISPWIPRNIIDHRLYDHSSIPATLESLFGLAAMTERDRAANTVLPLLSLSSPRTDAPLTLPSPAVSGIGGCPPAIGETLAPAAELALGPEAVSRSSESMDQGNLPIIVHAAMRQDLELSPPTEHASIRAKVAAIRTRAEAAQYLQGVHGKVSAARPIQ
jgi:phospholipase C